MRRREFVALLGSAAIAWPLAARAQNERMRRIAVFMDLSEDDPRGQERLAAFLQELQELGWVVGRNFHIDYRWNPGGTDRTRASTAELVGLSPDVILGSSSPVTAALLQATRAIPIVFTTVADPVDAGFVASLARPGGNATGFALLEHRTSTKWLELLKEIAPRVTRAAVLRNPVIAPGVGQLATLQAAAPSFGLELTPMDMRDAGEIERALADFAREPNGGVVVTSSPLPADHRELIITLAVRHRLPTIYPYRHFVTGGGLISYGPDLVEPFRLAAGYVDRILKGAKPADLPVQAPTKFELVINLKSAKAIGLAVPDTLLDRADEVIE